MTGISTQRWRTAAVRACRGRRALGLLAAGLAALIAGPALNGVAGAAPRPSQSTVPAANFLSGVSCPAATACWAVGGKQPSRRAIRASYRTAQPWFLVGRGRPRAGRRRAGT